MEKKPFYTSKTVWVFTLTLIGTIIGYVLSDQFPFELTPEIAAGLTASVAIGGIILRAISSGEIYFNKGDE